MGQGRPQIVLTLDLNDRRLGLPDGVASVRFKGERRAKEARTESCFNAILSMKILHDSFHTSFEADYLRLKPLVTWLNRLSCRRPAATSRAMYKAWGELRYQSERSNDTKTIRTTTLCTIDGKQRRVPRLPPTFSSAESMQDINLVYNEYVRALTRLFGREGKDLFERYESDGRTFLRLHVDDITVVPEEAYRTLCDNPETRLYAFQCRSQAAEPSVRPDKSVATSFRSGLHSSYLDGTARDAALLRLELGFNERKGGWGEYEIPQPHTGSLASARHDPTSGSSPRITTTTLALLSMDSCRQRLSVRPYEQYAALSQSFFKAHQTRVGSFLQSGEDASGPFFSSTSRYTAFGTVGLILSNSEDKVVEKGAQALRGISAQYAGQDVGRYGYWQEDDGRPYYNGLALLWALQRLVQSFPDSCQASNTTGTPEHAFDVIHELVDAIERVKSTIRTLAPFHFGSHGDRQGWGDRAFARTDGADSLAPSSKTRPIETAFYGPPKDALCRSPRDLREVGLLLFLASEVLQHLDDDWILKSSLQSVRGVTDALRRLRQPKRSLAALWIASLLSRLASRAAEVHSKKIVSVLPELTALVERDEPLSAQIARDAAMEQCALLLLASSDQA